MASESFNGGPNGTALGHGQYTYSYDNRGQPTGETITLGGADYAFSTRYNDAGEPTSLTYSDGEGVGESYDEASDALIGLSDTPVPGYGNPATNPADSIVYNANGQVSSAYVDGQAYTYSASYDLDARLESASLLTRTTGVTAFATSRTCDGVGNVTTESTTLANGTDNQAFCYDEFNRPVWASSVSGTPPCGGSLTSGTLSAASYGPMSFAYDPLNRMTSGPSGGSVYGDSAHRDGVTSIGTSYSAAYDAAGNMTCRATSSSQTCSGSSSGWTGNTMSYDTAGRMTAWQNQPSNPTSTEAMAYDGEGNRVALQVNGGSPTYYLGRLEELNAGTLTTYIPSAPGLPTGVRVGTGGSLSVLATDGRGSVDETLSSSGTVTLQQLFTPCGSSRYGVGTWSTSKTFTGQRADYASVLYYFNARYYDPAGQQFTSADTVQDGLNRYAYVQDNPETFTDPSGHMIRTCGVNDDFCTGPGGVNSPPPPKTKDCHATNTCGGGNPPGGKPPTGCQATHDCPGQQTNGSSSNTPTYFDARDLVSLCLQKDHPSYCLRFYQYGNTGRWEGLRVPDSLEDADYWWFVLSVGPGATAGLSGFFALAAQVMAYYIPSSGQWLLGIGASGGLNITELCFGVGIGVCTMLSGGWGRLLTTEPPSASTVAGFLSGMTVSTSAFYLYGASYVWSPRAPGNNPVSLEMGVASGLSLTVGVGNSWIVYSPSDYCNPSVTC